MRHQPLFYSDARDSGRGNVRSSCDTAVTCVVLTSSTFFPPSQPQAIIFCNFHSDSGEGYSGIPKPDFFVRVPFGSSELEFLPRSSSPSDHHHVPPRSRCKSFRLRVVAVATHVAYANPDHRAMLSVPPAHFDANASAQNGCSLTSIMSFPSESLAAFARKSAKRVVCVGAAPEFLKHEAAWFSASKISIGAAGSNLKTNAASAALIGLCVSCFVFPNIPVVTGCYGNRV